MGAVTIALRSVVAALLVVAAQPAAAQPQIVVLDRTEVARTPFDGLEPGELSGLAWDADEALLYAVSDRGLVFHFRLALDDSSRRIRELTPVFAAPLVGVDGVRAAFNAEGLALIDADNGRRGDTQLVVAVENGPRLIRFTPQGRALREIELPPPLRDKAAYRSQNSRLEAVGVHSRHGFVTAPQRPLKDQPEDVHRLYAIDGSQWWYRADAGSALKAIEVLPDGRLLLLERHARGLRARPVLRLLDLARCDAQGCAASVLHADSLPAGDNYEGLARLGDGLFAMISDDGGGRHPTRLVLFAVPGAR